MCFVVTCLNCLVFFLSPLFLFSQSYVYPLGEETRSSVWQLLRPQCFGLVKVTLSRCKAQLRRMNSGRLTWPWHPSNHPKQPDLCINKPPCITPPPKPPRDPPLAGPTPTLPWDGLLWNAAHGEESRCRRSICPTYLREREGDAEVRQVWCSTSTRQWQVVCARVFMCVFVWLCVTDSQIKGLKGSD